MTRSQLTREELQALAAGFLTERGHVFGDRVPLGRVEAYLTQFWDEIESRLEDPTQGGPHP